MKNYINDLMRDSHIGALDPIVKAGLYIISLFFGCAVAVWNFGYNARIFKIYKAGPKVISVGNITVGGTGKTPVTVLLARMFKEKGKKVCVLIRGYGRDESLMIKDALKPIPVIIGRDRVASANLAKDADVLILDDGFQHRRLHRDLDILLLDSANPFGNGCIFPRGILREPVSSVSRADFIILTKSDFGASNIINLRDALSAYFKKTGILESVYRPAFFTDIISGEKTDPAALKGIKICALSGIADPSYFKYMLKQMGGIIVMEIDYPDHQVYTKAMFKSVVEMALRSGSEHIVITEKDRVKIEPLKPDAGTGVKVLSLSIDVEIKTGLEDIFNAVS